MSISLNSWLADRVAAADPAYSRLRLASRAMLSLFLAGGALAALSIAFKPPVAAYGLTVILCFIGSLAVRDPGWRAQVATRFYAGLCAIAAAGLASLLAPTPAIADIAFLAVIFVSVYIRKFGARWFAVGMVAFLAYFIAYFLHPPPGQIGWLAVAAAIALATTQIVSSNILPDDPEHDFRRAMATIDHRINLILRKLLDYAHAGTLPEDNRQVLRHHVERLREIMLMAEGFIPLAGDRNRRDETMELAAALFDLQLAVERLVRFRHVALPPIPKLEAILDESGRALRDTSHAAADGDDAATAAALLEGVRAARARINATLRDYPSPAFAPPPEQAAGSGDEGGNEATEESAGSPPAEPKPRVPASLQRPIQVTLACALALGTGLLISPNRWFWAVITAFIVFNNTRSRADTALRAFQRTAGTLGGLFAGTAVAVALHGNIAASAVAIPVLFFLAFYYLPSSYGMMIFFVTIAIAVLYGLMGVFTPQLLVVRLEETVVGALAGTAVAYFVFPVRASGGVDSALAAFTGAFRDFLADVRASLAGDGTGTDLASTSRRLDRSYSDLAEAVRPLGGPWAAVTRFGRVREKLLCLMASTLWARSIADGLAHAENPSDGARARAAELIREIERELDAIETAGRSLFVGSPSPVPPLDTTPPRTTPVRAGAEEFVPALEAMRDLMRFAIA